MDRIEFARERRRQFALARLGSNAPFCFRCGEDDWRCLECHKHDGGSAEQVTQIICRNCNAKQRRTSRNKSNNSACVICGEDDPSCLEDHHIAGRKHDTMTVVACLNCHRKLSDMQMDHPQ